MGQGVDACARALEEGVVRTIPLELEGMHDPVSMRYYRSIDATTRFGPQHTGAVIDVRLRGARF